MKKKKFKKTKLIYEKEELGTGGSFLNVLKKTKYKKKFYTLNENLTFYESLGESKKYSFFGKNWIFRRKESFEYLKKMN